MECVASRCAQEPPPSSALFACLPKPDHLVSLKSGLGLITKCLCPFWWPIFTFVRNGPFCRIFYTPSSCWKGDSSTRFAPFPHPLCALCALGVSHSKGVHSNPYVSPPYYGALFVGDGVSLPIPPQFGRDECILTHITLYLNQKGGKSRAKLVGSSWYLTPLLWDTPFLR